MNKLDFYNVLFEESESVCLGVSVYTTQVCKRGPDLLPLENVAHFISINPLKNKRADINVTSYRNILIEFDELEPAEQLQVLEKVPFSTLVWSGGKSFHAILSLETPFTSKEEYVSAVRALQRKLPDMDKSTKNPSRFSRNPGVVRENGKLQELIEVRGRISAETLGDFLGPQEPIIYLDPEPVDKGYLPPGTRSYLRMGSEPGQRNSDAFRAACDMARAAFTETEAIGMMYEVADLSREELSNCITSAFKTVKGQR